jgi:hypothetical protein
VIVNIRWLSSLRPQAELSADLYSGVPQFVAVVSEVSVRERKICGFSCAVSSVLFAGSCRDTYPIHGAYSPHASRRVVRPTGTVARRKGDSPLLGGAAAPVMEEPGLRWRRRVGNRGVLDGHHPELGGNWALKREPNYKMVDSSSLADFSDLVNRVPDLGTQVVTLRLIRAVSGTSLATASSG